MFRTDQDATLIEHALAHIDRQIQLELEQQRQVTQHLIWLQTERQQLLDQAAEEGKRRR